MLLSSAFLMLRLGPSSGSFPRPLSAAEERKYVDLWLEGDIEARNVLIEHNLRLVAHIIKKYYTQADDADDLISIGTIGLIKGINTYRPEKGVRLATYASRCCENEILMHFRAQRKSAGDVSLSESIDVDGDGNTLSLMDIISQEDDTARICGQRPHGARGRDRKATLRPAGRQPPHPARDRLPLRHLPQLCIAHREEGAGEAAGGFGGGCLSVDAGLGVCV